MHKYLYCNVNKLMYNHANMYDILLYILIKSLAHNCLIINLGHTSAVAFPMYKKYLTQCRNLSILEVDLP